MYQFKRMFFWMSRKSVQALLLFCMLVICSMFVPRLFSVHCFCVQTGSMEPALPVGSLIYVRPSAGDLYEEGDIITYLLNQEGTIVTHRVAQVEEDARTYRTKGDANDAVDGKAVAVENIIGKVLVCIPWLGFFFTFLSSEGGKVLWIGLIIGLFILSEQLNYNLHPRLKEKVIEIK